jgi:hypothetical protein
VRHVQTEVFQMLTDLASFEMPKKIVLHADTKGKAAGRARSTRRRDRRPVLGRGCGFYGGLNTMTDSPDVRRTVVLTTVPEAVPWRRNLPGRSCRNGWWRASTSYQVSSRFIDGRGRFGTSPRC